MLFEKIAVHDFVFHADDVALVAFIYALYGEPKEFLRVSHRDTELHKKLVAEGYTLCDVGGDQFDHHSVETRKDVYPNGVIKSALGHVLDQAVKDGKLTADELEVMLANGLYALQAQDNGQDFEGIASPFSFVQWLNADEPDQEQLQYWQFDKALGMARQIAKSMVNDARKAQPEHAECMKAFEAMADGIADFPHHMKHSVLECQMWNAANPEKEVRFFTFPTGRGTFMVQGINKAGSFALNHELPFKGLRGEDLNKAAGIEDGVFVHPNGFIGGATSLESCHKLALYCIDQVKHRVHDATALASAKSIRVPRGYTGVSPAAQKVRERT